MFEARHFADIRERDATMSSNRSKESMDNRSRQLNPNDATYWSSRGETPPADVTPLEPEPPAPQPAPATKVEPK